jgi:hypothetical protein
MTVTSNTLAVPLALSEACVLYYLVKFNLLAFKTENLAAGTGSAYDIAAAIKSWTDEVCKLLCLSKGQR